MQFLLLEPDSNDNCDTDVTITYSETRTDGPCVDSYTLTRVWTATDNCGNSSTQSQLVTVQDTQDPVLANVPANITVECDAVPTAGTPTATDNCDTDVTITYSETRTDGPCVDSYTLTRVWTATDNCGNRARRANSSRSRIHKIRFWQMFRQILRLSAMQFLTAGTPTAT